MFTSNGIHLYHNGEVVACFPNNPDLAARTAELFNEDAKDNPLEEDIFHDDYNDYEPDEPELNTLRGERG
jgi:hypothetical protein